MSGHSKLLSIGVVVAGSVVLAGCMGPTYGTGKTAGAQFMEDLGGSLSLRKKNEAKINYAPRPDIVRPTDTSVLPQPQENIAETSDAWPESPEQRRQRILKQIDEGNRPANFVVDKNDAAAIGASEGPNRNSGGQRVYLTDPPSEYRQPAPTAEYGDLGVSEKEKAKAAAAAQGKPTGWKKLFPWL